MYRIPSLTCPAPVLVLLLWAAGLGAAGQFAKIAVPFAEFAALYPDAGARIGWLLTVISLIGAVFGALAGAVVSRMGLARMLLGGLVIGGVISLWQASLPGFPLFLFSRVIEGASHLAIVVAAPTLIAEIAPDRYRGAAMALWSTFFGVTFAGVALFGLPLVAQAGPEALFGLHGMFLLVMAVVLTIGLRGRDTGARHVGDGAPAGSVVGRMIAACRSPFIAAPGLGWLFYTLTFVSLLAVLPERLDPALRAQVTAAMPLTGTAVALVCVPVLMRWRPASRLMPLGFAGAALVAGASGMAGPMGLALACVGLFACLGVVQGAGFAAVPELNLSADDRAMGYGLMAQTGNLGNLLGTPVLLALLDLGDVPVMMGAVAATYALAVGALALLAARRRRQMGL